MKFIKIGAATIVFLSVAGTSLITVNAEDTAVNNSSDSVQEINVETSGNDNVVSETNENVIEESTDLQAEQATAADNNNGESYQQSALQSSMLKTVNQYGFDEEFFKWLQDHGTLPKTGTITQADLDKVIRIDHIIDAPFSSLEGIEQFKNLEFLRLNDSPNIKPEELNRLTGLTNLRTLSISFCESMTDVSPIANLPQLTELEWSSNGGTVVNYSYTQGLPQDISSLSGKLPNLKILNMSSIPILSPETLGTFTALTNLTVYSTGIRNIDFINTLPNLTNLDIRYDKVTDLSLAVARPEISVYAEGQLIVRYGDEALRMDLNVTPIFTTNMFFKVANGQYAALTGYTTDKFTYDGAETVTWNNLTNDDLYAITYRDYFANGQKFSMKTVATQYAASNLPTNIKNYSGTIYQEIKNLPVTLEIGNNIEILVGTTYDLMTGVSATDYDGEDLTAQVSYLVTDSSSQTVSADTSTLPIGTYTVTYSVTGKNGDVVTKSKTLNIIPLAIEKPEIDIIYEDEDILTGTAPANATVEVTCPYGSVTIVTADAAGNWSMPTEGVITKDDMFTAVTVHTSGQTSERAEQIVLPVIYTIDANDVTMTVSQLQTLRSNGTLETYVLEQANATASKTSRTTKSMEVHGDMTPLADVNEATRVQVTTYVPADSSVSAYDANNTLIEKTINVTVTADGSNGSGSLPNTGQDQITPVVIGGAAVVIAGITLLKRNNKQRK